MRLDNRAEMISKACEMEELSTHIKQINKNADAGTWAEKIACRFRKGEALPVKNSYMYCDTLDMCFFYTKDGKPCVTYAGYVTADCKDMTAGRLVRAFIRAGKVLQNMKKLIEGAEE